MKLSINKSIIGENKKTYFIADIAATMMEIYQEQKN